MKKTVLALVLATSLFSLLSCNSDDDNVKDCAFGFEKDTSGDCNTAWAEKFIGTNLACEDTCKGNDNGVFLYNTNITMEDETTLSTTNLFGYTASNIIKMKVTGVNEVTINDTDAGGRTFKGTGILKDNQLIIDVVVTFSDPNLSNNICKTIIAYPKKNNN